MEPIKTNDWKTWLTIAVVVLTALLQAVNGGKIDSVEKKVEKTIEKSEKVEKEVGEIKAKAFTPVNVTGK